MEEDEKLIFSGHLMKNTDHHKAFLNNEKVLVIFSGPHAHVSASWYKNPAVGSTWNYITVHAKGRIKFLDEEATVDAVRRITSKYEAPDSPAAFDKLAPEYVNRLVKAIVAFEIDVDSVENVFKLSQNYDAETRKSIIEHLNKREDPGAKLIAMEMNNRLKT
jgi:transcriptional regulator